jgi:citrate lyase beta subunit
MLRIISQNIINYGIEVPDNTILRINLAWCSSVKQLRNILEGHKNNSIFIDLPIKRIKPPNNKYTLNDLISVISSYNQIKYFAISNVESANDLEDYIQKIPPNIILVPKIESPIAIQNVSEIVNAIPTDEKILMLDHDDLFSKIIKNNESIDSFQNYIQKLSDYCNSNKIILLRTIGVMFSDEEKRISDYIK